jgi:hypothetical protein
MARVAFTPIALDDDGYNITDSADFDALATGAGNGVFFDYDPDALIVLKNTTGGAAAYTVKIPTPSQYSAIGITLSDMTVNVAAAKSWFLKPHAVMKQADGDIYIDCDVAGSILVVTR